MLPLAQWAHLRQGAFALQDSTSVVNLDHVHLRTRWRLVEKIAFVNWVRKQLALLDRCHQHLLATKEHPVFALSVSLAGMGEFHIRANVLDHYHSGRE
jgi:hypothetical protein